MLSGTPFRRLWGAAGLAGLSTWMVQIALFYGVLHQQGAPALAWLLLIGTLPALLLGPALGAAVDRWPAGRAARLAGYGQAACLAALLWALAGPLPWLMLPYAASGLLGAIDRPARQRLLYQLIPRGRRPAANASLAGIGGIVSILGAVLGGSAALIGLGPAVLAAAALRAGASALLPAAPPGAASAGARAPKPYWQTLTQGWEAVRRFPRVGSVLVVGMAWGLIGGGYDVLLSDYGVRLLHGGRVGLSLLYAADGLGVLAGTLLARRVSHRMRGHVYGWSYLLQGAFWTVFAASHTLAVALPALLLMRVASGVIIAWDTTLLLETVPDGLHGRMISLHAATYGGVMRLSLLLTGACLALVGAQAVAWAAGVGSMAVGLAWWATTGRHWPQDGPAAVQERVLAQDTAEGVMGLPPETSSPAEHLSA